MKAFNRALDDFHSLTRRLAELSETDQVVVLKSELLEALERADGIERELECLEDAANLGEMLDSLSLPRALLELQKKVLAAAPLEATHPPSARRALKELRVALLEMERRCHVLDAFCRLLMRRTKTKGAAPDSPRTPWSATP